MRAEAIDGSRVLLARGREAAEPAVDERTDAWRGGWIGPQAPHDPDRFVRVLFRRTFDLIQTPSTPQEVRVTADSRYIMLVNGREIGRGPQRSQPYRIRYDAWDIAGALRSGRNVIAVLVTWFGDSNAVWTRAEPAGDLGIRPALLLDGVVGEELVATGPGWRAQVSDAWSTYPRSGMEGLPAQLFDARRLPPDWAEPGYDDAEWADAVPVRATHHGLSGRWIPPVAPYGLPHRRSIAPLGGPTVEAADIRVSRMPAFQGGVPAHPVEAARAARPHVSGETRRQRQDSSVSAGPAEQIVLDVDFGRVVVGSIGFSVDAPAGTVIDLAFHERLPHQFDGLTPRSGIRYVARGDRDDYRSPESVGLRSMTLRVQPTVDGEITLSGIRVEELLQPMPGEAAFASADPAYEALWAAGVRTVQANSSDAFTDCPSREQRAWVGDGVVHQAVHLVASDDWSAARAYVDLACSPRPDGLLPMSVVSDLESPGQGTIPSWSLHWVHAVHALFWHAGATAEVVGSLAVVRRVLEWFVGYRDERGTLADLSQWNLIDWSSVITEGRSAAVTALWCRGLREYAELSDHVGDHGSASWARVHYERAAAGFEDFWDPERQVYVDSIVRRKQLEPVSQATNAAAIVAGLVPTERWDAIIDRISDPDQLVTRSWLGAVGGGLDQAKWARVRAGTLEITWDARHQVVRAEPFFSYVVHDAYAVAGRTQTLLVALRSWSAFLHEGYDTFGEAWGWGTPCHGWSATPTKDLTRHVLGVTPQTPGFDTVRVAPRLGTLAWVSGAAPTPHGLIRVAVRGGVVELASPVPALFVASSGRTRELPPGHHWISLADGEPVSPGGGL
jgi:hypothetical protein